MRLLPPAQMGCRTAQLRQRGSGFSFPSPLSPFGCHFTDLFANSSIYTLLCQALQALRLTAAKLRFLTGHDGPPVSMGSGRPLDRGAGREFRDSEAFTSPPAFGGMMLLPDYRVEKNPQLLPVSLPVACYCPNTAFSIGTIVFHSTETQTGLPLNRPLPLPRSHLLLSLTLGWRSSRP
jgi:hypothetical protein